MVSVDIAARGLFPENARCYLERVDLAIDHHPSQEFFARETCLDAGRAACGELIYDIAGLLGPVTREMAVPLYVAVSTDTGCFVYGNTTADTHRTAAALMETGIACGGAEQAPLPDQDPEAPPDREPDRGGHGAVMTAGKTAVAAVDLADGGRSWGPTSEDLEDIASFVGQVEGVETAITIRELEARDVQAVPAHRSGGPQRQQRYAPCWEAGATPPPPARTVEGSVEEAKRAILWAIEQVRHG